MTKNISRIVLALLMMVVAIPASAAFKDFKIDLTAYNDASSLLTADEVSNNANFEFGIAVADDGTISRVDKADASATAVISGKYHNDHGCTGVKLVVPVDGAVKIGVGNCTYSGHTVKVKDGTGTEVASFAVGTGCWSRNKSDEVVTFGYYRGGATTLTIESSSYTPFIMVAAATDVPTEYTATFSWGDAAQEGSLPANIKVTEGKTIKIPVNFTLYQEGKTLTGWTDGKNTYAIGEEVKMTSDLTLTPVFTANAVALADRTEPVTIKWDFQQKNGAPAVAYQNKTGFWVAQAVVNGKTIDVKTDFDTNNGGKFANGNWQDWAQLNGGTKFTIPSCKGAIVNVEAYNALGTGDNPLKIDGQSDYVSGKTISYEIANTAETIDVVIGSEGSYYRYIQVVLPVVQAAGGKTFNNEAANVVWNLNDVDLFATPNVLTPEDAFTLCTVSTGDFTIGVDAPSAGPNAGIKMLKLQPGGDNRTVEFIVKPTKGLTFSATKVSAKVARFGTDGGLLTVAVKNAEGEEAVLATGLHPARNNKDQAGDKWGSDAKYTTEFTFDVPSNITTSESFTLVITEEGELGASKQIGIGDVHIEGTVNGTAETVAKYTVSAKANPENGGSVNVYPNGNEFDAGTELKLTATEKFGFDFVNWTDGAGNVISEESVCKYVLNDNVELIANFKQVDTYALNITIEGGANDYMVALSPAPTIIDGKNMYEAGTVVALEASSNPILTFTNWSSGETSSLISVTMDADKAYTATYSAADYIVGWDFIKRGNNGRPADFKSTSDNEAATLIMTNAAGKTAGWLDKSNEAAGGYESFVGAAVNWNNIADKYYYQTKINAAEFMNIKVQAEMMYNYNAYQTQKIEYSIDGQTWTEAGRVTMESVKKGYPISGTLGEDANNSSELYIRFIPDYESNIDGTTSDNDGTTITNIFVFGEKKLVDDGKAPVFVSSVPADGGTGASATGKIVLNFDEKVKLTAKAKATLGYVELEGSVTGKSITFPYKSLSYNTKYTFTLAAGSVADLTDNTTTEAITINFTTMDKPTVTKALYDFIVPDNGNFKEALIAAAKRTDTSKRYRIFVRKGNHIIPANEANMVTGNDGKSYPDPKTSFGSPNVSIIGEDMAETTVANTMPNDLSQNPDAGAGGQANPLEGIRTSGLLYMTGGAKNTYFQDITLKTNTPDATGRNVILVDGGDRTICKNVNLWAYQDTYVSDNSRALNYFEGGIIRGRTDFICGSGDVFFNAVDIIMCEKGGYIVAPRDNVKYGYVFKDCTLKGEADDVNGNYYLGRPWTEAAETYFIDCKMEAIPYAAGWTNMSDGGCTRFAEYNSTSASGNPIDMSGRVTELGKGTINKFNPILSASEAAEIGNMNNMFGDWNPREFTEQAPIPTNVTLYPNDKTMDWDNSDYALLWAVCKNGKAVAFTTEPIYTVDDVTAEWSVRAANEMGGLGEAVKAAIEILGIENVNNANGVVSTSYYNLNGVKVSNSFKGTVIKVETLNNGKQITSKIVK